MQSDVILFDEKKFFLEYDFYRLINIRIKIITFYEVQQLQL